MRGGDVNEIIGELIKMDPRDLIGFTRMTGDVIKAMRECPIPIISGIQGIAAGAGSVIAIASDFRVCSTSARFAFLFTRVGLSGGDMGAAYLLPRLVGAGRATELLMLGDTIDADHGRSPTAWSPSWSPTTTWTTPSPRSRGASPTARRSPTRRPSR